MKKRTLPNTDLAVSPICLGTMTFGTPVGEKEAIDIVHQALDVGVNFIDTANMYEGYTRFLGSPGGSAEEYLGAALADRRQNAVLATKAGNPIGPEPEDKGLSRAHLLRECERSLSRLRTDYLDLYYLHLPDPDTPIAESITAMNELIQAGKVRHWGISNFDAEQTREVIASCDTNGWTRPVVHQPPYSLLKRDVEEDLLPLLRQENIGVVPYQILQGGLLTGKYADPTAPPEDSRAAEKPEWLPLLQEPEIQQKLRDLTSAAQNQDLSLFDYTLRKTLEVAGITSIILGVKRPAQIAAAVEALA